MSKPINSPALNPDSLNVRIGSSYPAPFKHPVEQRVKRALSHVLGLEKYGVNIVELPPGAWSSQRHWHTHEDEFVYVVKGELTLVTDSGPQVLTAGMVAGFPAGKQDGHHLVNNSAHIAVYLEVGDRSPQDEVHYPDIDMVAKPSGSGGRIFTDRNGEPY